MDDALRQFKRNDLVVPRAGGEVMLVASVNGDEATCVWLASGDSGVMGSWYRRQATFAVADLVLYKDPD